MTWHAHTTSIPTNTNGIAHRMAQHDMKTNSVLVARKSELVVNERLLHMKFVNYRKDIMWGQGNLLKRSRTTP
jgi:hypothetical protein